MLKTEEYLNIQKIEELRLLNTKKGLDKNDNFSWHVALKEDENLLGVARLFKYNDGVFLDKPCLYTYKKENFDLLFRTMLLKTLTMKIENIYVPKDEYFLQFGFKTFEDNIMKVKAKDLVFPKLCGGCKGCE